MSSYCDILFLTCNRLAYTKATLAALIAHTDWSAVRNFVWYDDNSTDETADFHRLIHKSIPVDTVFRRGVYGSPVVVMRDYLKSGNTAPLFAKIDNDTLVPAHWLTDCLHVMDSYPSLHLLGIEAFAPVVAGSVRRSYYPAQHIGGIGLMRTSAFEISLPIPNGQRYGFTEWQHATGIVTKGWLDPALPVVLLDRLPYEPWLSLSACYVKQGWQRSWPLYHWRRDAILWPTIVQLKGQIYYEPGTIEETDRVRA